MGGYTFAQSHRRLAVLSGGGVAIKAEELKFMKMLICSVFISLSQLHWSFFVLTIFFVKTNFCIIPVILIFKNDIA